MDTLRCWLYRGKVTSPFLSVLLVLQNELGFSFAEHMFAWRWWEPTVQELTRRQLRISSVSTVFAPLCSSLRWQHQVSASCSSYFTVVCVLCLKSASLAAVVKPALKDRWQMSLSVTVQNKMLTALLHLKTMLENLAAYGLVHRNLRCQCDMQSGFSHRGHPSQKPCQALPELGQCLQIFVILQKSKAF